MLDLDSHGMVCPGPMLDDYISEACNSKHHGPVLQISHGFVVMRCSLCEEVFNVRTEAADPKAKKSSLTCVSACDWTIENKMVRCRSCNYSGPAP